MRSKANHVAHSGSVGSCQENLDTGETCDDGNLDVGDGWGASRRAE